ncbi:MAG: hypothetical protein ACKOTZ_02505 [Chloroflexota bacterium]
MNLYHSPAYVAAATEWDTTRKAAWVADSLADRPIAGVGIVAPAPATPDELARVHDRTYIRAVRSGEPASLAGSNGIGWDARLFDAVAASTGGAVAAALDALATGGNAGSLSSGLHHARRGTGAGFCTFNGLALAADAAIRAGARGVLVLDLDAHCGGGTASILGASAEVVGLDVATSPFDTYDPPADWTLDLVTSAERYLPTIRARLDALDARGATFDLVLHNAGMDPFAGCRIGGLAGIDAEVLGERERLVFAWARTRGVPVAFVLAGGYASTEAGQAELVELHRATIAAAAGAG